MRGRRIGRPGLLGTVARTAVVAGTATATVNAVGNHQANKQMKQEAAAEQQQPAQVASQQQPAQQSANAGDTSAISEDTIEKLKQLGELKSSGVLTDEEFATAKAKLLGS